MARRGFAILFTFLGVAFFISVVGFGLLYVVLGREPAVPANAILVPRVGGDLAGDRRSSGRAVSFPAAVKRRRCGRSSTTSAKPKSIVA